MGKATVGVLGQGFVGGSLAQVLVEREVDVLAYDKAGRLSPGAQAGSVRDLSQGCERHVGSVKELVVACEQLSLTSVQSRTFLSSQFSGIYFVCVPTPMNDDGSCDVSVVESVLEELAELPGSKSRIAVVKSTVPPGSTARWNERFKDSKLRVVFNPEFLREASALDDMRNQDRIVLGGPKVAVNRVRDLYRLAFPNVPTHKTSSTNAEFIKYFSNCFLAMKVSFANEMYQVCEKFDPDEVDYDRIVELASLDERLGKSHWKVPGPMPADDGSEKLLRGYGGSCFVKDINAMIFLARELGVDPKVMTAAWAKNEEVRPERDWEKLVGRAVTRGRSSNTKP